MSMDELDPVVLLRDFPREGLRAGDIGTIVMVYTPEAFEVEFVTLTGDTRALLTLSRDDIRPVTSTDAASVRELAAAV